MPLFAFGLARLRPNLSESGQMAAVWVFAAGYTGLGVFLFQQAMAGQPLIG